jgi:hypothetical protein
VKRRNSRRGALSSLGIGGAAVAAILVGGFLAWLILVALIALPISLVLGAIWNALAPGIGAGFGPVDGITAWLVTLGLMLLGSFFSRG